MEATLTLPNYEQWVVVAGVQMKQALAWVGALVVGQLRCMKQALAWMGALVVVAGTALMAAIQLSKM